MVYKDSSNRKSNQQNLGTIRSSNLCAEIIEYSDSDEAGVCNLAAIVLPSFVNKEKKEYDFQKLYRNDFTHISTNINCIREIVIENYIDLLERYKLKISKFELYAIRQFSCKY